MNKKMLKFVNNVMIEYEIYDLVDFYDPILRKPTEWIDFDLIEGNKIATISMSLMETLNKFGGVGLSANQIGLPYRMFAVNMGDKIWCFINPKIIKVSDTKSKYREGCLSYPGLYISIGRADSVTIEFQAANGEKLMKEFNGLTATCILHEMDHLDGIMFTDKIPKSKLAEEKKKIKSNLKKMKKLVVPPQVTDL